MTIVTISQDGFPIRTIIPSQESASTQRLRIGLDLVLVAFITRYFQNNSNARIYVFVHEPSFLEVMICKILNSCGIPMDDIVCINGYEIPADVDYKCTTNLYIIIPNPYSKKQEKIFSTLQEKVGDRVVKTEPMPKQFAPFKNLLAGAVEKLFTNTLKN